MMRRILLHAVIAACVSSVSAPAQGILGGQGFGFPTGQMGARAAGTGGALAPFDAISPVNPASVSEWIHGVIFFHAEPEFRSTSAGGPSSSTRETRFPLVGGGARLSPKLAAGLTLSTYLDRTWETTATGTDTVGGTPVALSRARRRWPPSSLRSNLVFGRDRQVTRRSALTESLACRSLP